MNVWGKIALISAGLVAMVFGREIGETAGKFAANDFGLGSSAGGLDAAIRAAAIDLNKQLPIVVDTSVTLLAVTSSGSTMNYHHKVSHNYDEKQRAVVQNTLGKIIPARVCSDPKMKWVLDRGGSYSYQYVDARGIFLTVVPITAKSCGFAPTDPYAEFDELINQPAQ